MAIFGNKMMVFKKIIEPNLILDMKFHNNIIDDTGYSVATSNGITFENGVFSGTPNNSVRLNANSDYIIIPDSNLFSFTDGVTDRPFKIKFDAIFHNLGVIELGFYLKFIMSKRGTPPSSNFNQEWQLYTSNSVNSPKLEFNVVDNVTGGTLKFTGSTILMNGVNYKISMNYDGAGNMAMSLNGVPEVVTKTTTGTYTKMRNTASNVKLGSTAWNSTLGMNQNLENLKIWKY